MSLILLNINRINIRKAEIIRPQRDKTQLMLSIICTRTLNKCHKQSENKEKIILITNHIKAEIVLLISGENVIKVKELRQKKIFNYDKSVNTLRIHNNYNVYRPNKST